MMQIRTINDLLVVDLSHWQGEDIDFKAMKAAGVKGVILKATEGTSYVDPTLYKHYKAAKEAGLLVGFYHFARFGDEIAEANHFKSTIKGLEATLPGAKYALDLEKNMGGFSPDALTYKADRWLSAVGAPEDVIFYSYTAFIKANITKDIAHRRLWLAHYTDADRPGENGVWSEWYIWQYTSGGKVNGVAGRVDLNAFFVPDGKDDTNKGTQSKDGDKYPDLLNKGDKGDAVKKLQTQLEALGYDVGSYGIDGSFGPDTLKAVVKFQTDHHLKVDGLVGKETQGAIDAALDRKINGSAVRPFPRHVYMKGDHGADVKAIQHALNTAVGHKIIEEDGRFGRNTEKAVREYQDRHGLKVDGLVGRYTWNTLF